MELLEILNPWWKDKAISKELALPYRRKVYSRVKDLFKTRQITVISGLRRVGKSTLIYQLIEDLLKNTKPEKILYFSFDEKIDNLIDILKEYYELTKTDWKKEKCLVFLDEIQKLSGWSDKLKVIYDGFPNLKIVISGSSSFQLERDAISNLAGRHFVINVEPLNFIEYLELKESKIELNKMKLWEEELIKEFKNYLYRPFPEIVKIEELSLVKNYLKENVMEKVLKIDLSKKFKNVNEDLLTTLIDIFYDKPGMYINYDNIAKDLGIAKKTLIQHIYYLEFTYVLRRIKNYRPGMRTISRKLQRIYPFHWALRFGWNGKIDSETAVASYLDAKYYWRKDFKEVDFLIVNKDIIPIEVKESSKVVKGELKPLIYFMKKFNKKEAFVIYNGNEGELRIDSLLIRKMPLWKMFLKNNYDIHPFHK